jgi:radical SAM superfamily enzyme YgiQ (UPF0313 family)
MRILLVLNDPVMIERLGVMYLSSGLKKRGHEVRLVQASSVGFKGLRSLMNSYSPAIVGYSVMTGEHMKLLELNRALKEEFKFSAVFGGPHATFFPELIKEDGCDAICVGEGDIVFPEFCDRVSRNDRYWQTPNFIVKYNGGVVQNPLSALIENLDELPFPDRGLMYEAEPPLVNDIRKCFHSARGCAFKCTYCYNAQYNEIYEGKGRVLRNRSPESMINEICALRDRYPLGLVFIGDDTFIAKPKDWFNRFCALYKERINLPFSATVRADLVKEELIDMLRDAGLDSVWMGVECGNQEISRRVLGRTITNQQLLSASAIMKDHGIKIITQNLIGLPVKNSYGVDLQTLDLNIKIGPVFGWSSILYPYPGTQIEKYAKENGFLGDRVLVFETNKKSSAFNFSREQKKRIEHLHKLFGLIVQFPILRRYCNLLCKLPFTGLYNCLFYFWYGYCIKIKLYPFLSLRKELGSYIRLWWNFIHKS